MNNKRPQSNDKEKYGRDRGSRVNNLRNRSVAAIRFASLWIAVLTLLAGCGGGGSGVADNPSDPGTASPPPGPHTVEGEVFAFATGMIGGASINLWVQQGQQGYSYWWAHGPLMSDDLGLFEAPDLPDSHVSVDARKEGYMQPCAVTSDVRGDVSVRVELMPASAFDVVSAPRPQLAVEPSVSGVVFETTATGRQPVAGAVVWLEETMGITYANTLSDRSGGYFVCNVGSLPTAAWLTVRKDGFETHSVGPVNSSEAAVVDIELMRL